MRPLDKHALYLATSTVPRNGHRPLCAPPPGDDNGRQATPPFCDPGGQRTPPGARGCFRNNAHRKRPARCGHGTRQRGYRPSKTPSPGARAQPRPLALERTRGPGAFLTSACTLLGPAKLAPVVRAAIGRVVLTRGLLFFVANLTYQAKIKECMTRPVRTLPLPAAVKRA